MRNDGSQVCVLGLPAQLLAGLGGVSHQAGGVAGAAGAVVHGYGAARDLLRGVDDFLHRKPVAVAQVVALAALPVQQALQRQPVG